MQHNRKESFQLLQLSDDSKSLSDLEVPEILPQRKRKVRRKTRNTGNNLGRPSGDIHEQTPAICQNLGLWIAIFMSCGWLLILSYMTTVVYTENRRLEAQISKISVNSQTMPDVLQKWHETTKYLEGNQTAVNEKIVEIQTKMDEIDRRINEIQEMVTRRMSDSDQTQVLQKNVATFGAEIKDLTVDIESLKSRMGQMKQIQEANKVNITKLSDNMKITFANTSLPIGDKVNNSTAQLIANRTEMFNVQLKYLNSTLFSVNDTISQRIKSNDDELKEHRKKLENLTDNVTNLNASVITLQGEWNQYKIIDTNNSHQLQDNVTPAHM